MNDDHVEARVATHETGRDPAPGASGRAPATEADPRRWKALWVCLVAGFMTLLDVSIVNVALPSIQTGVHATPSDLQWVVSGYALAFGLTLVPAGRLGAGTTAFDPTNEPVDTTARCNTTAPLPTRDRSSTVQPSR